MTDFAVKNGLSRTLHNLNIHAAWYDSTVDVTFIVYGGNDTKAYGYAYKHGPGYWEAPILISNLDSDGASDAHGLPGMALDDSGFIHVFHGAHANGTDLQHAKSNNPRDMLGGFTDQSTVISDATYSHAVFTNGERYVFMRKYQADLDRPIGYVKWDSGTGSWGAFVELIAADNWNYPEDYFYSGTKVYFFGWERPGSGASDERHDVFAFIFDTADDSVTALDGTAVTTPADATETHNKLSIDQKGETTTQHHIVGGIDENGDVHVVYYESDQDTVHNYRHGVHNGTSWSLSNITSAPSAIADRGTQIIVHSSTNIDAFLTTATRSIERYNYNGTSWSLAETLSPSTLVRTVMRVVNGKSEMRIVIGEEDLGDFSNADLKVFAWGDSGFIGTGSHV